MVNEQHDGFAPAGGGIDGGFQVLSLPSSSLIIGEEEGHEEGGGTPLDRLKDNPVLRTLIFGLGNPILSDDAIGLVLAREVHARVGADRADLVEASVAGLEVLDIMSGYDHVVVIDAIQTKGGKPGDLYKLAPDDLVSTPRLASPHDVDFGLALKIGKQFDRAVPARVSIYAVEVEDPYTFGEALTPGVAARVPALVEAIVETEFGTPPAPAAGEGESACSFRT